MSNVIIEEPVVPLNSVCAFLASQGMVIANRFGVMAHCEGDLDWNRIGILESFPCDIKKQPARRFLALIYLRSNKDWEIEVYGRHYAPHMRMMAEELCFQFHARVTVGNIYEEVRYENVPSWD